MKTISERLKISEYQYPLANILNPKLHNVILDLDDTKDKPSSVKAKMTDWKTKHELFDTVINFTLKFLEKDFLVSIEEFMCSECWGILYNRGDYVEKHNHEPSQYSFVYYVNTPKGSSPLIFDTSGFKIKPSAGKLIIFDSKLYHHIPKNNCDGRSLISGNFVYKNKRGVYGLL